MRIYHWESARGNFGDDLNRWFWPALMPGLNDARGPQTLVGVGTLLNDETLAKVPDPVVIGSGVGYGARPSDDAMNRADIRCVRGPMSARYLGLSEEAAVIDPAVLIPDLRPDLMPQEAGKAEGRPVFIPHHSTDEALPRLAKVASWAGLKYKSPSDPDIEVISAIASSRLVVTESMHGAILADAFGVPWVAVRIADKFNSWKWQDWGASLDMTPIIHEVGRPTSLHGRAAAKVGRAGRKLVAARGAEVRSKVLQERSGLSRTAFEAQLASRLHRAARRPAQLSSRSILERQKQRLYTVARQVERDYGL
jgi:succinoglycan biosynthesis protein ExoV